MRLGEGAGKGVMCQGKARHGNVCMCFVMYACTHICQALPAAPRTCYSCPPHLLQPQHLPTGSSRPPSRELLSSASEATAAPPTPPATAPSVKGL